MAGVSANLIGDARQGDWQVVGLVDSCESVRHNVAPGKYRRGTKTSRGVVVVQDAIRKFRMSKEREATASTFWREMFLLRVYKRSQGRIVRQVTFGALFLAVALGCWRLMDTLTFQPAIKYGLPLAIGVVGIWFSFRLVNLPRFADFLIAVEAEMVKVSWPTWGMLVRSATVVIIVIFGLAAVLFGYDTFWNWLLTNLLLS
jgi:preprotein translocase subunit SecE